MNAQDNRSVWMDGVTPVHPSLTGVVLADAVVVGAGITGLSTALRLHARGMSVVVLEASQVGGGNTGRSTGNLYGTVSRGLQRVRAKWSADEVRQVVALRTAALAEIERNVEELSLRCDFHRVPLHVAVAQDDPGELDALDAEFSALQEAGLDPKWIEAVPGMSTALARVLQVEAQAQFNPWAYVQGLADALMARGVPIHEHSAVVDIDAAHGVSTRMGQVYAPVIVLATHTPPGFNLVQAEMRPYTEYGISMRATEGPEGICWIRDEGRSVRRYQKNAEEYLVVVGETHPTGEVMADPHAALLAYARKHWQVDGVTDAWSAQQLRPADELPYVGRSAHDNVLVATGFAADGLTWGTVAAAVIDDIVAGEDTAATQLLRARRLTVTKSAAEWAKENTAVVGHLVGDRLSREDADSLLAVSPGEGRLLQVGLRKYAVYRDLQGVATVLSPVCTHLRCLVQWNPHASSWDCPCHGSRFHPDGRVMDGPATQPLECVPLDILGHSD